MQTICVIILLVINEILLCVRAVDCRQCSMNQCSRNLTGNCCKNCKLVLKCKHSFMEVILPKYHDLSGMDISLADSNCSAHDNQTHYSFLSKYDRCGTQFIMESMNILFKNEIRSGTGRPLFALTCKLPRKRKIFIAYKDRQVGQPINYGAKLYFTTKNGRRLYKTEMRFDDNGLAHIEIIGPKFIETTGVKMTIKKCVFYSTGSNERVPLIKNRYEIKSRNSNLKIPTTLNLFHMTATNLEIKSKLF